MRIRLTLVLVVAAGALAACQPLGGQPIGRAVVVGPSLPACPHDREAGAAPGPDRDCRNPKTVTLSGTAYTFNTRRTIAGAQVGIDELPGLVTTTAADGTWALEVPERTDVTPWIRAAGHHELFVQTFHTQRDDIGQVNFQTPTDQVYEALKALLTGYLGRSPLEDGCVVVSTVSDPRVVDMTFDEFIHFAPHGLAGATAYGDPAMPDPIYFNDSVLPDPNQPVTSGDGGVLWANVPPGVYEVSASHPTVDVASFTATCVQDRIINANPPWGLHGIPADG